MGIFQKYKENNSFPPPTFSRSAHYEPPSRTHINQGFSSRKTRVTDAVACTVLYLSIRSDEFFKHGELFLVLLCFVLRWHRLSGATTAAIGVTGLSSAFPISRRTQFIRKISQYFYCSFAIVFSLPSLEPYSSTPTPTNPARIIVPKGVAYTLNHYTTNNNRKNNHNHRHFGVSNHAAAP